MSLMLRTRVYCNGKIEAEEFPLAKVSDYLEDKRTIVWVDFTDPTEADLAGLEEELNLHQLAVEDAVQSNQRPKLDHYATHNFLVCYDVRLDSKTGELATSEIKAFITPRALVTVHRADFSMADIVARWDSAPDLAVHGMAYLIWGLLDTIVDGQFDAIQSLDNEIETLEDQLFENHKPRSTLVQRRSFELRKSLVLLRRVVLPMREVIGALLRRDVVQTDPAIIPYLQDVYDHVLRVTDWTDSLRDLVNTILETNISLQGNRMNLVMKKVTSWAAIIAVPTLVTGFYGQNVPYPGFSAPWGFWVSSALIIGAPIALYAAFKRHDWL
jgi:magnesium transporter